MDRRLRLLSFATLLVFLSGCPYSSDPGPADVQGTWIGTLNPGSSATVSGAFIDGGPGFLYGEDGTLYAVDGLRSSNPLSGTLRRLNAPMVTCAQGAVCSDLYALVGTGYSDLLVLSASPVTNVVVGPQQFGIRLTRTEPYVGDLSNFLSGSAGSWQGYYLAPLDSAVSLSVDAAGDVSGSDALGCSLSGTITQLGASQILGAHPSEPQNLFALNLYGFLDLGNNTCTSTLVGVGYLSTTGIGPFAGVPGTYLYMGLYGGHHLPGWAVGYMVVLKVR